MSLTASRLREILHYEPSTGRFAWKIRRRQSKVGDAAGWINAGGYHVILFEGRSYYAHRLAWLYTFGQWPATDIDHINGNPSDNRLANLRLASRSQNLANAKRPNTNTSGAKGVTYHHRAQKWMAYIGNGRRQNYLGLFDTIEEAHAAYCAAALKIYREFARSR